MLNKTKRKIFEKSMQLFADKGYDSTSIEEITSVVGIAKGTFYYHFSKKEDLFYFLVEEGMKLLKNSIEIKTKHQKSSIEQLKKIVLIQIKVTLKYESFIRFILGQVWGKEEKNDICRKYMAEYVGIIENIIKCGIDKNEICVGNSMIMAYGIVGVISAGIVAKQNLDIELNIQELHKEFWQIIFNMLKN